MRDAWAATERFRGYGAAVAFVGVCTVVVALVRVAGDVNNASMLYLVAVLATAVLFGSRPAVFGAFTSFLAYDFFFISPRYELTVAEDEEWIALGLLLVSGMVVGQLASAVRNRVLEAEQREREAIVLYDTVRILTAPALDGMLSAIGERLRAELDLEAVLVVLPGAPGGGVSVGESRALSLARDSLPQMILTSGAAPTAEARGGEGRWIRVVGPKPPADRDSKRNDRVLSVPVNVNGVASGAIVLVRGRSGARFTTADNRLLSTLANQLGGAMERITLQEEALEAEALRRTHDLRKALLDAVSHDFRTPLTSIIASAGSIRQDDVDWTDEERRGFADSILQEADRLNRLVGNLLDLSRIEAGALRPEKAWHDLAGLVEEAAGRAERLYPGRTVRLEVSEGLPPVHFDYIEIDQALWNLIENSLKYGGGDVSISVVREREVVRIEVNDDGPGIPPEVLSNLFRPFYRAPAAAATSGSGLGLAIARGFVRAHGGETWAANRPDGGATFGFTLPLSGQDVVAA